MRVLVGVDGSDSARRALIWAAREARQHHGRLTVCWTGSLPASSLPTGPGDASSAHGTSDRIEDEIMAVIAEAAPDLDPRRQQCVVLASLEELFDLARDADLLVMARPHDRHFAVQPGAAVTRRLTNESTCPILLVP